jgi:hypothetical protein
MRSILAAALVLAALGAHAQLATRLPTDLDKPGALAKLEKERPDHYRAVLRTAHATERMHCAVDFKLLQIGDKNPCKSYIIRTSYPAQVALTIPLDDALYAMTVYLDPSADRLSYAK